MSLINDASLSSGFVLFAQANLHKQLQASAEIVMYLISAMKHYRYDKEAGILMNKRKPSGKQCCRRRQELNRVSFQPRLAAMVVSMMGMIVTASGREIAGIQ